MDIRPVDARDAPTVIEHPTYRVYFWTDLDGGFACEEYEVTDAEVDEVYAWAEATAGLERTYVLYAAFGRDGAVELIRLAGEDPTAETTPGS